MRFLKMNPSNQRALITGSSTGLGYETALALASQGVEVMLSARSLPRLEQARLRILEAVPEAQVHIFPCDITRDADLAELAEATRQAMGSINVLVANGGGPPSGRATAMDLAAYDAAVALNLRSMIALVETFLGDLREAVRQGNFGRILFITSMSAKEPLAELALSNVTRAGVQGYAKSLASDIGREGITVNTILPGYTETDRLHELADQLSIRTGKDKESIFEDWRGQTAVGRLGRPEEFAAAAAFLVGPLAGFITGTALSVDGGRSRGLFG